MFFRMLAIMLRLVKSRSGRFIRFVCAVVVSWGRCILYGFDFLLEVGGVRVVGWVFFWGWFRMIFYFEFKIWFFDFYFLSLFFFKYILGEWMLMFVVYFLFIFNVKVAYFD